MMKMNGVKFEDVWNSFFKETSLTHELPSQVKEPSHFCSALLAWLHMCSALHHNMSSSLPQI